MKRYVCPLTWPEDTSKAIYDLRLENAIDIQSECIFGATNQYLYHQEAYGKLVLESIIIPLIIYYLSCLSFHSHCISGKIGEVVSCYSS